MKTKRGLASAMTATAIVAISGAAYAATPTDHNRRHDVRAQSLVMQAPTEATSQQTADNSAHRYHGGPKSND